MTSNPITLKPCPWCDHAPEERSATDGAPEVRCRTVSCPATFLPWLPVEAWNCRWSAPVLFAYDGPAYQRPVERGLVLLDHPRQYQVDEVVPEGYYHVRLVITPRA